MIELSQLPPRCFQGVIPALLATCSLEGLPNTTYLSQVFRTDERHVALSCQFFNKTKQNTLVNPQATIVLYDPLTFESYRLELEFRHSEEQGTLFDSMASRIQAIASHTGLSGVFKLRSADIYEVVRCERLDNLSPEPAESPPLGADPSQPRSELRALQLISQSTCRASSQQQLFEQVLGALDEACGFAHSMVFLLNPASGNLQPVASHGYGAVTLDGEVAVGEGLVGTVAERRQQLRINSVGGDLRYGRAIRADAHRVSGARAIDAEVPLPGLADAASQMAIPLVVEQELLGVLVVESSKPLAFDDWDETFLEIVANQVAVRLSAFLQSDGSHEARSASAAPTEQNAGLTLRFFEQDDCVFAGDEYLIRNVPGRILWKLLRAYVDDGRTEFSNRELRLDPWLRLPPIRDNLESRLVLLRKRLEAKCCQIRLVSTGRGCFRLEADCELRLEEPQSEPDTQAGER